MYIILHFCLFLCGLKGKRSRAWKVALLSWLLQGNWRSCSCACRAAFPEQLNSSRVGYIGRSTWAREYDRCSTRDAVSLLLFAELLPLHACCWWWHSVGFFATAVVRRSMSLWRYLIRVLICSQMRAEIPSSNSLELSSDDIEAD